MKITKAAMFLLGAMLLVPTLLLTQGDARVDVHIGVYAAPPAYSVPAPPPLVVIPGTYIYLIPGINVDIFFYSGYWYRPYGGRWYRSRHYNGPWGYIVPQRVPYGLTHLPPNYRYVPQDYRRIPYNEWQRNWRRWEREKYWDTHREWREERREHRREERREHREDWYRKHGY